MSVLTQDILIANEIKFMIENKNLQYGSRLPSERELSTILGVQRLTVRLALKILIQEGLIYKVERQGYFVAKPRIKDTLYILQSETEFLKNSNINGNLELVKFHDIVANKHLSSQMKLPLGTKLFEIIRLLRVDEEPATVDYAYIESKKFPDFKEPFLKERSIFKVLKDKYDDEVKISNLDITVIKSSKEVSDLLEIEEGSNVILQRGLDYTEEKVLVSYSEMIMKPERFSFVSHTDRS